MSNPLHTKEAIERANVTMESIIPSGTFDTKGVAFRASVLRTEIANAFESGRRFGRREAVRKIQEALEIVR